MENKYYFCCGSNEMHIKKKKELFQLIYETN